MPQARTRVLVIDDSASVRQTMTAILEEDPELEVIATASDPFVAAKIIQQTIPDVITLDVEMPRMDGLSFLRRIMERRPMPVLIVSAITQAGSAACVEALRLGAIDVIAKPGGPGSVDAIAEAIKRRIRSLRSGPAIRIKQLPVAAAPAPAPVKAPAIPGDGLLLTRRLLRPEWTLRFLSTHHAILPSRKSQRHSWRARKGVRRSCGSAGPSRQMEHAGTPRRRHSVPRDRRICGSGGNSVGQALAGSRPVGSVGRDLLSDAAGSRDGGKESGPA